MLFSVDNNLKVIFGWSAKAGCSHVVKIYWYLQNNIENNLIHTVNDAHMLPNDIENYIVILFIRNPYDRLVSGFIDKYNEHGQYRKLWKSNTITFSAFVDELIKENWNVIDKHHFTPQTTEHFNSNILNKSKKIIIYDINNIDYSYIEKIYNKTIPENLIKFRGGHERKKQLETIEYNIFDLDIQSYVNFNVSNEYFYNDRIKNKIYNYYKNDFIFFSKNGFNYS